MFEAYSVAVKLSVNNLASQGLRAITADFMKAHGGAVQLQQKLEALKLIGNGWAIESAGKNILGFLDKSVKVSEQYVNQLSLMNAAGMTQKDIAEATTAAWTTSHQVMTSSAAENLKAIRELRSVLGANNMGEAYGILPTVQRTKAVLESLTGKEQDGVAFDMIKAIELSTPGLMTQAVMQRKADLMAQSIMGMGGTINPSDFHMTEKAAKTAAFGLSDEFLYRLMPTLMQEVKTKTGGSQSAGTALMTGYRAVVQGVIRKASMPAWEAMGLLSAGDVVRNATGSMQVRPGGIKDSQLFQQNPYQWANEILAPAIASYGAKHHLNREQVISALFGDRNAQWFFNTLIAKAPQFERDRKLIEGTGDNYSAYQKLMQTNPQLAQMAMQKQWENVQARIGYEILPRLVPYMVKFADTLDGISSWMNLHPGLTESLVLGLGGVAASFVVIGKAMMGIGIYRLMFGGAQVAANIEGVATGIAKVATIPGLATAGAEFTSLSIGLGSVLGVVAAGIATGVGAIKGIDAIKDAAAPEIDPITHPGMRRFFGVWRRDMSLDQTHYNQHFVRSGRGSGYWAAGDPYNDESAAEDRAHIGKKWMGRGTGWVDEVPPIKVTMTLDGKVLGQVLAKNLNQPSAGANAGPNDYHPQNPAHSFSGGAW